MKAGSRVIPALMLLSGYAFALSAFWIVYSQPENTPEGYNFLVVLVAVPFLLAAHGFAFLRWSEIRRLRRVNGRVRDLTTNVSLSVWEIFFCWLGISTALIFLFYAAPSSDLNQWYSRMFLVAVVFFGATLQRALVFIYGVMPFVFTLCVMGLWTYGQNEIGNPNGALNGAVTLGFLLVDLFLLGWAYRLTKRHGIFGFSELELPNGSGLLGGHLTGVIRTGQKTTPESGYQLELSCIRQDRGGAGRRVEVVWHAQKLVRGDLPGARYPDSSIPVGFSLPDDALPSCDKEGSERVGWTLRVRADLPEADYSAAFEVPIEREGRDARETADSAIEMAPGASRPLLRPFSLATAAGLGFFRFSSRWNASTDLVLLAYVTFWVQLVWLASDQSVTWQNWVVALAGLAIGAWAAAPWVRSTEVTISDGEVRVWDRFLGGRRKERRFNAEDVSDIKPAPDDPRPGLIDCPSYYRLILKTLAGEEFIVGRHIRGRKKAERIAHEIEGFLKKESKNEIVEWKTEPAQAIEASEALRT